MAVTRTYSRSFSGGEVSPEFFGRVDDVKYQTGLGTCRNFLILPHGPAANRAGTAFVREVKNSAKRTKLIPFSYSTTQTMILEFGEGYIRFHTLGQTLLTPAAAVWSGATIYTAVGDLVSYGGVVYYNVYVGTNFNHQPDISPTYWYPIPSAVYEIPTTYLEAELFDIHYVQSADVLTLTHPLHPPAELRRLSVTRWVLSTINFASTQAIPTALSAGAHIGSPAGTVSNFDYKVTGVDSTGTDESLPSTSAGCSNNLFDDGAWNSLSWAGTAARYNVYKSTNGAAGPYGFIGQTTGTTFTDDNVAADISRAPPITNLPFTGAGNYPRAVSYYEQRRDFAGTVNAPQNIWMTKSGTESNLQYSIPSRDDDAIQFRIAAREANTILHIVPLGDLVLLTSSAEWRVASVNSDALTPTSISVKPQSYIGASNVQPSIVNNNLIYCAARGGHIREMAYNFQASGYVTGDLSLRAPHLFDGLTVADMTYVKSPQPIVWFVSSNGQLLGLTYVPEQQVGAWHRHDTDGLFESVAAVAEGDEDALYVIVRRTIDGDSVRYVERMASRAFATLADAFFVDAGVSYTGAPITTVNSGIDHLEGKTVSILIDGAVHPQRTVTSGSITLDDVYAPGQTETTIQIGLPYVSDLVTLPMAFDIPGMGQGRPKNVNKVWLRVYRSSGVFAGPDFDTLTEFKQRTTEPYGSPPSLHTGQIEIAIMGSWGDDGEVYVRQVDPLPLTITALTLEVAVGG